MGVLTCPKGAIASAIISLSAQMKTTEMSDADYADKMEDIIILAVTGATGIAPVTIPATGAPGTPSTGTAAI